MISHKKTLAQNLQRGFDSFNFGFVPGVEQSTDFFFIALQAFGEFAFRNPGFFESKINCGFSRH